MSATDEPSLRRAETYAEFAALVGALAHEIRNPLASIAGSFSLLRAELDLNPDQRKLAEIITRETERLNRTITEILSYARLPSPRPQDTDLSALIQETLQLLRNSPEVKPEHQIDTALRPVQARVDQGMMKQVFYNLAANAFKAMPGGGTLTITLEGRNGSAHVQFRDTGVGLGEEEMKRLFVPFNSTFHNGTGLGLPIVYQIVTAHNGSISVKSRKGIGTTFVIDL